MLVITRRLNQRIRVGVDPEIWITIADIRKDRVRIGIDAPPEIVILREELDPPPTIENDDTA